MCEWNTKAANTCIRLTDHWFHNARHVSENTLKLAPHQWEHDASHSGAASARTRYNLRHVSEIVQPKHQSYNTAQIMHSIRSEWNKNLRPLTQLTLAVWSAVTNPPPTAEGMWQYYTRTRTCTVNVVHVARFYERVLLNTSHRKVSANARYLFRYTSM